MNVITVLGNLAADPELRVTPAGTAMATLVVVQYRRVQQDGEWVEAEPNRFEVEVGEALAEYAAESLRKGGPVVVVGSIITSSSTSAEGQPRTRQIIRATTVVPSQLATARW